LSTRKQINLITLGCSKNVVDSEKLMARLRRGGYALLHDSEDTSAQIVIINTCGFITEAKEESISTILAFAEAKRRGAIEKLFVLGCLSERYKDDLRREIGEVDEFFGVNSMEDILASLGVPPAPASAGERLLTTPQHYAYLKISEGCSRRCSFCAIPLIRGGHVSTPIEELVGEATLLAGKGVKELMVVAQDTTSYGVDIYGERRLAALLGALSEVDGVEWIRLHYAYPAQLPSDVIDALRSNGKVCRYLDVPFQHVSDAVLKLMRRGVTRRQTYSLIDKLRRRAPGVALRTTLMVGHPGEDEAAFAELMDFVREVKFDRLGVFTYSEEEGTYGAKRLKDTLTQEEKRQRADAVMKLQAEISAELNRGKVGKTFKVMLDRREGDYYVGRTEFDSPEVDGEVLIPSAKPLRPGSFYSVKITSADEFDLYGEVGERLEIK
jgi:ribosomal protein S12 methylthiotransferase